MFLLHNQSARGVHMAWKGRRAWAFACAFLLTMPLIATSKEYDVFLISDDVMFNREPMISETGLVAWYSLINDEKGEIGSEIMIYTNKSLRSITKGQSTFIKSNIKPQVQSNIVVWVAAYSGSEGPANWVLREVLDDGGPIKELDANYRAEIDANGKQTFVPSSQKQATAEPDTNQTTTAEEVPAQPTTTNTAPFDTTKRSPSGENEINYWDGNPGFERLTVDTRNDLGPSVWGRLVAWQKAKGWPFGWEIMAWNDGVQIQLTTNFYYDMAPKVHKNQIVWYGWDGHDFEIYLYDTEKGITQITSNQYDDVSPVIWDGMIAWEGYAGVDADIYTWKEGEIKNISKDNIEDDLNPRIWNGQVVWQGFDGDDFEIYLYDGARTIKLTSNQYDDVNPDIRDEIICWMGYHDNWDAEIFVWDGGPQPIRITDNDYEDRDPKTAAGRVVWQANPTGKSLIYMAVPKD